MENVIFGALVPHPPIAIPQIGGQELENCQRTVKALQELAQQVKGYNPETIVMISPHGPVFQDVLLFNDNSSLRGDLARFGAGDIELAYTNDLELGDAIRQMAGRRDVPTYAFGSAEAANYNVTMDLDHGVLVPLYYLQAAGVSCKLVSVTMGLLSREELYTFGMAVRDAASLLDRRVVIIASGDLSHGLTAEAPSGYLPQGAKFDEAIVESLRQGDFEALLALDRQLISSAAECGYRPTLMLLGAFEGWDVSTQILSYEGPFGVGYCIAGITPVTPNPERNFLPKHLMNKRNLQAEQRSREHYLVSLARTSLVYYLDKGEPMPVPEHIKPEFAHRAGVFVSLKKDGELRGCIGTTAPTQPSIVEEVIANAISAGTQDPRFNPVELEETEALDISVDVLHEPEPIKDTSQLDPRRYGVIVRKGRRSGLLLPNLEGIDTVQEQVEIAKRKAGLNPEEEVELYRFEVVRYE